MAKISIRLLGLWWGMLCIALMAGAATAAGNQGELILTVTASCTTSMSSMEQEKDDGGYYSITSKDSFSLTFSARYRFDATTFERISCETSISGGGSGGTTSITHVNKATREVDQPQQPHHTVESDIWQVTVDDMNPKRTNLDFISLDLTDGTYSIPTNILSFFPEGDELKGQHTISSKDNWGDGITNVAEGPSPASGLCAGLLGMAQVEAEMKKIFTGKFTPKSKHFSTSKQFSYTLPILNDAPPENSKRIESQSGQVTLNYTLSYNEPRPNLEAVVIPANYDTWLPIADEDEDTPGKAPLAIMVELRDKDHPERPVTVRTAKFRFELLDTSKMPGICLNEPSLDQAKPNYDLQIRKEFNTELAKVDGDGQWAETEDKLQDAGLVLSPMDYGAYAKLRVTATLDNGEVLLAHLDKKPKVVDIPIPCDENNNRVADAWEKSKNITKRLAPEWDGAEEPKGQNKSGDGISLYEKYRGFMFHDEHERLNPHKKHLFIYDPDGIVQQMESEPKVASMRFSKVSELLLRYVDESHWTGEGSSAEGKRIVNFNHGDWGNAVEQTALHVTLDNNYVNPEPPNWRNTLSNFNITTDGTPSFEGMAFPDVVKGFGSPKYTYQIIISSSMMRFNLKWHARWHMENRPEYVKAKKDLDDWPNVSHYTGNEPPSDGKMSYKDWLAEYNRLGERKYELEKKLDQWVDEYMAEHPKEVQEYMLKRKAMVVSHELGHGVGIQHHEPVDEGNTDCSIRYPSPPYKYGCTLDSNDPLDLKIETPWPDLFCHDANSTAGGKGCWIQMMVTDGEGE